MSQGLRAQGVALSGTVADAQTTAPLQGATVLVRELNRSAVTNETGRYTLSLPSGTYSVSVAYMGYGIVEERISVRNKSQVKNFALEEQSNQLDEITINAAARANITKAEMSVEKLDIKTIKRIPQLMGEVDVIKSIMLLPGVQPAAEGTSSFSVRGGSHDQNLILFDQATVYNASHLMGFFSVFNNDVVDEVTLYKGDIPAGYGGRLSSLLNVQTKDGDMEKFNINGGVGLISSRLEVDGPMLKNKLSFVAAGRRTYADLFLPLSPEPGLRNSVLHFYDLNGKLCFKASERDKLSLSGYFGKDVFGMGDDLAGMNFSNTTYSLAWEHRFSDRFSLSSSFIGVRYAYSLNFDMGSMAGVWDATINDIGLREDFALHYGDEGLLKFGLLGIYHNIMPCDATMSMAATGESPSVVLPNQYSVEYALYVMNQHTLGDRLTLKYGLRGTLFQNVGPATVYSYDESYKLSGVQNFSRGDFYNSYWGLEPRLGAVFRLGESSSVKASYARTMQFLHLISNSSAGSPLDVWMASSPSIKPQSAQQGSLGYFRNFRHDAIEASAEVFYKYLNNVVDFKDHAQLMMNPLLEGELRSGVGYSYGLELMLRKNTGTLTGWVSYTYAHSYRKVQTVNDNEWYRAPSDRPHNLNVVLSYDVTKRINLSANWTYATGSPVTYPEGMFEIPAGEFAEHNSYVPIYGKRNTYRMPDYHRLDLAATFTLKKHGRYEHDLNLSLYNAYGRHNPWYITFREEETQPGMMYAESVYLFSVVPSITYNFKF